MIAQRLQFCSARYLLEIRMGSPQCQIMLKRICEKFSQLGEDAKKRRKYGDNWLSLVQVKNVHLISKCVSVCIFRECHCGYIQ